MIYLQRLVHILVELCRHYVDVNFRLKCATRENVPQHNNNNLRWNENPPFAMLRIRTRFAWNENRSILCMLLVLVITAPTYTNRVIPFLPPLQLSNIVNLSCDILPLSFSHHVVRLLILAESSYSAFGLSSRIHFLL